jgi:hypothetical protein
MLSILEFFIINEKCKKSIYIYILDLITFLK